MLDKIKQLNQMTDQKSRAQLGFFPTPFYKLERLSERLGVSLYIKRDDFSGMSLFGGNKIRKLEYIMGDALQQGCDTVITYGATQSNHAMQTATACRRLGLTPILYLTAYVEPDEKDIRANMLLDRILGAEMHIVRPRPEETPAQTKARATAMGKARAQELAAQGHRCYDVPIGGANPVGTAAFARGYGEMLSQCNELGIKPDYVFSGTGSGGTLAGMVAGHRYIGDGAQVIGIADSASGSEYEEKCAWLCNEALRWLGSDATVTPEDFIVDRGYYHPGYEQPNEEASQAIRLLARTEGLLLDPVYSGKAFAGVLGWLRSGQVPPGSTVVFWHTGGATALFSEPAIIGSLGEER